MVLCEVKTLLCRIGPNDIVNIPQTKWEKCFANDSSEVDSFLGYITNTRRAETQTINASIKMNKESKCLTNKSSNGQ